MKPENIDEYIEQASSFAKPVLKHIRYLIHQVIPFPEESIKWGFPNFSYQGHIICHMAAFKNHCSFGFWKGALLSDSLNLLHKSGDSGMGHFSKIKSLKDLPEDAVMMNYIRDALKIQAVKIETPKKRQNSPSEKIILPDYLKLALEKNLQAKVCFENFSQSKQKDYIDWFVEAKTETTRDKRLSTALAWIANGKGRNWKYEKKK